MKRVAVLQPAFLGDVVFASPLTRAIGEAWPGCEVAVVVRPPADQVARHLPFVTHVIPYDKRGSQRGLAGLRSVAGALRAFAPEVVASLHESPRSAALAWLSGAPVRVGPSGGFGSALYTHTELIDDLPFVERGAAIASRLGLKVEPRLELRLAEQLRARGREVVPLGAVALIPGSEWETKRWPIESFGALARSLLLRGRVPIVLGSPAERGLCATLGQATGGRCFDFSGNSVEDSLGLLAACAAVVGGDTGLTHAARALGVRTVALFGPTNPLNHQASARDSLVSLGLACSPCSAHGQHRCPLGHHRCLRELPADLIAASLAELL